MAGAGFKDFQAGAKLTAEQVDTYLMQQSVMRFASSAARSSAIGTAVAEGMVSYLQDSNSIEVYNGSSWVGLETTLNDGTAGYTALSNGTAGITYQPVSHNYIINGAFDVWQRGTSVSLTGASGYQADRFLVGNIGNTAVYSQQTFTPAELLVNGFGDAKFYARVVNTSVAGASNFTQFLQRVEDVRGLAGQTVTLSYYAKADAAKSFSLELQQSFGSGGSASVNTFIAKQALTTSWARYSHTFTVPSTFGKTLGASSYSDFRWWLDAGSTFDARTDSLGQQSGTFDIWGVQLEAGSVATPFKRHAPSLQGELAACQRYYWRYYGGSANVPAGLGYARTTTVGRAPIRMPVTMRTSVSSIEYGGNWEWFSTSAIAVTSITIDQKSPDLTHLSANVSSGLTQGNTYMLQASSDTTAYIGFNSEL